MTQHNQILEILKQTGRSGMNSWLYRRKFIQLPVRIRELKTKGYLIVSKRNEDTSVNYVLLGSPKTTVEPKKPSLVWEFKDGVARQVSSLPEQQMIGGYQNFS